jgi:hypothetical protein
MFKWNDYRSNGKYITNAAFFEQIGPVSAKSETYRPTFTIADEDHDGLYSFPKLFLKHYQDPTEMTFVNEVFEGDLKHWETFKTSVSVKPIYERLRRKADLMLQSDAIRRIVDIAMDDTNRNSFTALKYLADRAPKPVKEPVGRPKKVKEPDEVDSKDLLADIERLR